MGRSKEAKQHSAAVSREQTSSGLVLSELQKLSADKLQGFLRTTSVHSGTEEQGLRGIHDNESQNSRHQ